jgi:hypothetical protein
VNLDNAFWLAYIVVEAALVGLLVYRRVWRLLPFFFVYCIWDILSNGFSLVASSFLHFGYFTYLNTYLAQTIVDSALQFAVLVELAWSVLRPIRSSLPRSAIVVISFAILAIGAAIWPFTVYSTLPSYSLELRIVCYLVRTVSILRILIFIILAGCSQWLSIGWRSRELQVATGLGFYSLVTLAVAFVQPHLNTPEQYIRLTQLGVSGFLCALLYWIISFSQKEEARGEFTPQMQKVLLAVAGAARTTRISLEDSRAGKPRRQDQR